VVITAAGRELQKRMWPVYGAAIQKHVGAPLGSDRDAEALWRLLEPLAEND
jgi:hypothetical protein